MPVPARIVLALCCAVLVLYATASLSGNWLATPPWWMKRGSLRTVLVGREELVIPPGQEREAARAYSGPPRFATRTVWVKESRPGPDVPCEGREAVSIGVGAVGLALAGFAVLGRRRPETR